jgi:hypothetical protein
MAPWTFDIKFPLSTQFTFGSLTFAMGEDRDLEMLPPQLAPKHPAPTPSSTSGGACSSLDSFVGLYIRTTKLIWGIPIVTSILRHLPEHRFHLHQPCPSVEIHLTTTTRSGPVPTGTPQKTAASSLWWPQTGINPTIAPVDIPLLEDQRHLMLELLALAWFRI